MMAPSLVIGLSMTNSQTRPCPERVVSHHKASVHSCRVPTLHRRDDLSLLQNIRGSLLYAGWNARGPESPVII